MILLLTSSSLVVVVSVRAQEVNYDESTTISRIQQALTDIQSKLGLHDPSYALVLNQQGYSSSNSQGDNEWSYFAFQGLAVCRCDLGYSGQLAADFQYYLPSNPLDTMQTKFGSHTVVVTSTYSSGVVETRAGWGDPSLFAVFIGQVKSPSFASLSSADKLSFLKKTETAAINYAKQFEASLVVDQAYDVLYPTTTETKKHLPIIIIPGIGGTELQRGPADGCGLTNCHEVWPRPFSAFYHFTDMRLLDDAGEPAGTFIYATSILDSTVNFYGSLETFLVDQGYVKDKSLFVFPYDWRLDNGKQLDKLDALVNLAMTRNSSQQVVIIAHSMGGLVAAAYVNSDPSRAAKVNTIITMGTPFFGSTMVYYGFTEGYGLGNILANLNTMKSMMRNWPGVYQLLPKVPFVVNSTNHKQLTLDQTWKVAFHDPDHPLAYSNLNPDDITTMKAFNARIGTPSNPLLPSTVKLYTIIGYDTNTLSGYTTRAPLKGEDSVIVNGEHVVLVPHFGPGDGTVPSWGLINSRATGAYYITTASSCGFSASHGKIPANPTAQAIAWKIIDNSPPKVRSDIAKIGGCGFSLYPPLVTDLKTAENIDFTIRSHANLEIVDAKGGTLGFNGPNATIVETLPQGTFIQQNGIQYASIANAASPYKIFINGTSSGTFTLDVNVTKGGKVTTFIYADVAVQNGSLAQLSYNPSHFGTSTPALPTITMSSGGQTTQIQAQGLTVTTLSTTNLSTTSGNQNSTLTGALDSIYQLLQPIAQLTGLGASTIFYAVVGLIVLLLIIGVASRRKKK